MGGPIFGVDPDTSSPEDLEQIGSFILFINDRIGTLDIPKHLPFTQKEATEQARSLGNHLVTMAKMKRSENQMVKVSKGIKNRREAKTFASKTIKDYFKN